MLPRLFILSGAGLDKESGINTFRDTGGTWDKFDLNEVCNIRTWAQNYEKVHSFYNERRMQLGNVEPNAAHHFIAEMQKKYGKDRVINITANVSDLLERAGVEDVLHIHGELTKVVTDYTTPDCDSKDIGYAAYDYEKDRIDSRTFELNAKPDVIFFGEMAPAYEKMNSLLRGAGAVRPQDTVVVVGTQLSVVDYVGWFFSTNPYPYKIMIDPAIPEYDPEDSEYMPSNGYSEMTMAMPIIDRKIPFGASRGFELVREDIEKRMDL
ncbi:Sir2 (NAD-dependent deacetylase) [Vibrio phage D479]